MSEWQPIKTAKKDDSPRLLLLREPLRAYGYPEMAHQMHKLRVVIGWYDRDSLEHFQWECSACESHTIDSEGGSACFPIRVDATHWQPLPDPP